jgi:3-oxoacyl-[acyl-carrier protein] reductase
MAEFAGKVALVTGGARGIGRATAVRLARGGAKVAINYKGNAAAADEAKRLVTQAGGEATTIQGDVSVEGDVDRVVREAVAFGGGRVDILVNNAGIFYDLDQKDQSLAYLRKILDVNMIGPWLCARAVFPTMKAQGKGKIINQSSGAAWMYAMAGYAMRPDSDELNSFNYSISKAGVNALTHFMAAAMGQFGINVNAIAPGVTMTDATRKHVPEGMMGAIKAMSALRRTLEPDEIASAAVFLASDESDAITGQVIPVDAGVTMLG